MDITIIHCPNCQGNDIHRHTVYETKNNGERFVYKCSQCGEYFSETKNTSIEGLRTPVSVITDVLNARTEGTGLNACSRIFNVSKNTVIRWERRFASLMPTLMLYALMHNFLQMTIEGDETYTKVDTNKPASESEGWTIILMERASRFIWELRCGEKDRHLFERAIEIICQLVENTQDMSLITDGERRYGQILFEVCNELVRNGKPGRPRKTLRKGVKARVRNKGSQAHKKGPKRPKYQAPCPEHPETVQNIENKDIHANHVESLNSSLRRRNSAYRRRTNTYAKSVGGLQRTLDMYWIIHNFVRSHFTAREVPAVALGIIDKGLSLAQILMVQKAA